jgi:hypothetical protein
MQNTGKTIRRVNKGEGRKPKPQSRRGKRNAQHAELMAFKRR